MAKKTTTPRTTKAARRSTKSKISELLDTVATTSEEVKEIVPVAEIVQATEVALEDITKEFLDLCENYDQYWEMSDDGRVARKGAANDARIKELAQLLVDIDHPQIVEDARVAHPLMFSNPTRIHILDGDPVSQAEEDAYVAIQKAKIEAIRKEAADAVQKIIKERQEAEAKRLAEESKPVVKEEPKSEHSAIEGVLKMLAAGVFTQEQAEKEIAELMGSPRKTYSMFVQPGSDQQGIAGFSPSSIIRWMASKGFQWDDCRHVMDAAGMKVSDITINCQYYGFKRRGPVAPLDDPKHAEAKKIVLALIAS